MRNPVTSSCLVSVLGALMALSLAQAQPAPSVQSAPMIVNPAPAAAQPLPTTQPAGQVPAAAAPTRDYALSLTQLSSLSDFKLFGISNLQSLEFTLPRNQIVTQASLELVFTPSPALLPKVSHLRVYLNDELMQVVPIAVEPQAQQQSASIPLDPGYLSTYNRIRIEFVGHYAEVCEDAAHSSLWIDLSRRTHVRIQEQALMLANELSFFPEPFLDVNDMLPQTIPLVFAGTPTTAQLETAATLTSYFGTIARWRNVQFPASFDKLPDQHHAVVLATNQNRPAFLKDYPKVEQATVDMISAPDNPYQKLLLILGRDDADLKTAVMALTLGKTLFRGQSVTVDAVANLAPRKPYDAPNWIPIDRPVYFSELVDYPGQLEVAGLRPRPINLNINIPPDLFVWRSNGIPLNLLYRYTAPLRPDESRLTLSLNNRFVSSYSLRPQEDRSTLTQMRLQVMGNEVVSDRESPVIPAFRIGSQNQIGMNFSFASTVGGAQAGTCQTTLPVDVRAGIDGQSTIDFSGYAHYVQMPNLRIFANSGFPFSRMADLSETMMVVPQDIKPDQVTTLLKVISQIGSQTGYPAYKLRITNDWNQARAVNADLLWIGATPDAFRDRPDANLLLNHTTATLTRPLRSNDGRPASDDIPYLPDVESGSALKVSVRSVSPIAAIVGMQSPYFPERSMVGLLATNPADLRLLNQALNDTGKRDVMQGSVVIIRTSGVSSHQVGPSYFIGNLQWWQRVWFHFSERPFLLASLAALGALLTAWMIWGALGWVARRRLNRDV